MGLRCLTVRVSDRTVRHLISTGYLSLESSYDAAAVAIALEAWIADSQPRIRPSAAISSPQKRNSPPRRDATTSRRRPRQPNKARRPLDANTRR